MRTIYKRMRYTQKMGKPGLKYHVRIVGGAIGKALLFFPEARSPSHLVEELLASRIICTTYGLLSIWLLRCSGGLCVKPHPFASLRSYVATQSYPGTTASHDRYKLLTHQAFAKAISIHFLSCCFEASCVSREAFLACL